MMYGSRFLCLADMCNLTNMFLTAFSGFAGENESTLFWVVPFRSSSLLGLLLSTLFFNVLYTKFFGFNPGECGGYSVNNAWHLIKYNVIAYGIQNMCNIWTWICGLRINRSSNLHHTPTETSCNGTMWLNMENLILWDFRSCIHWDWNQLHYKQDECGICITIMHHMNVVVHKIHCCCMICVIEFMNHGCSLSYMAVKQQFCCSSCRLCGRTHLLC